MECPSCHSEEVYSSRPRGESEKVARWVTHSQYFRCHACGHRERRRVKLRRQERRLIGLLFGFLLLAVAAVACSVVARAWLQDAELQSQAKGTND